MTIGRKKLSYKEWVEEKTRQDLQLYGVSYWHRQKNGELTWLDPRDIQVRFKRPSLFKRFVNSIKRLWNGRCK